jgi:Na+-translocating ferredoxin:NAD+ oxidoreductase RnfA subunit
MSEQTNFVFHYRAVKKGLGMSGQTNFVFHYRAVQTVLACLDKQILCSTTEQYKRSWHVWTNKFCVPLQNSTNGLGLSGQTNFVFHYRAVQTTCIYQYFVTTCDNTVLHRCCLLLQCDNWRKNKRKMQKSCPHLQSKGKVTPLQARCGPEGT